MFNSNIQKRWSQPSKLKLSPSNFPPRPGTTTCVVPSPPLPSPPPRPNQNTCRQQPYGNNLFNYVCIKTNKYMQPSLSSNLLSCVPTAAGRSDRSRPRQPVGRGAKERVRTSQEKSNELPGNSGTISPGIHGPGPQAAAAIPRELGKGGGGRGDLRNNLGETTIPTVAKRAVPCVKQPANQLWQAGSQGKQASS